MFNLFDQIWIKTLRNLISVITAKQSNLYVDWTSRVK